MLADYAWVIPLLPLLAAAWIAVGYVAGWNRGEPGEKETARVAVGAGALSALLAAALGLESLFRGAPGQITLLPLRKDNQHEQWPAEVRRALGRVRHRVETALSTLTTAFNINRPRGRSLAGYVVRIATCILAHTLSFLCG